MRHASAHPSNRCPVDALCEFGVGPFFHFLIYSDNFRSWWSDDMVVHDTIRRECQSTGILADGDTPVVAYDNHLGVRHFHPELCTGNTWYINNNQFEFWLVFSSTERRQLKSSASNENSNIPIRHCSIGGLNFSHGNDPDLLLKRCQSAVEIDAIT